MNEEDEEMLKVFLGEIQDNLSIAENALLIVSNDVENMKVIDELFRAIHNIKGGSSVFGFTGIINMTHVMETLLSKARTREISLSKDHIDALLGGLDKLIVLAGDVTKEVDIKEEVSTIEALLNACESDTGAPGTTKSETTKSDASVSDAHKSNQLNEATKKRDEKKPEEKSKEKPEEIAPVEAKPDVEKKATAVVASTLKVRIDQLNKLVDLAGELILARNQLLRVADQHLKDTSGVSVVLQKINLIASELQEEIMNARMQPISTVFNKFNRVVHDLAGLLKKKISLTIEGGAVELDKTIVENLSDPLTHIIRNSADHGLETTQKRLDVGKTETGHIYLRAYHLGGLIHIEITDDGGGIDTGAVAKKAVASGIITEEALKNMSDSDKLRLIFAPGLSTAKQVSGVSGRGVGMDVVLTNIKKLGGTIDIKSQYGKGTTFHIALPLTMAIVSSLIVEVEGDRFAISQVNIDEIVLVNPDEIDKRLCKVQEGDVLKLRGELLPIIHLADGIGKKRTYTDPNTKEIKQERRKHIAVKNLDMSANQPDLEDARELKEVVKILVLKVGRNRLGIIVDEVIGGEEIVIKPMPEYFKNQNWFSGATILGDGKIALILDVNDFAAKNEVIFSEITKASQRVAGVDKYGKIDDGLERVNLLVFNNGTKEQLALPIAMIQRVDEIELKKIEEIGNKEYLDYNGESMLLFRFENILPVCKPIPDNEKMAIIIIPRNSPKPLGILIKNIVDTKNIILKFEENEIESKFILGASIISERITMIIDLPTVIESIFGLKLTVVDTHKRVLLVEDTKFYQDVEKGYLVAAGYEVTTALSGKEALKILTQQSFDFIITDIEMPEMNGLELVEELREKNICKDIPIIAVTSVTDERYIAKSKELGFTAWIQKLNKAELIDAMKNAAFVKS